MGCNTTAGQYLSLKLSFDDIIPVNLYFAERIAKKNYTSPLPISAVTSLWELAGLALLALVNPTDGRSFLFPSLEAHNLSYLGVGYFSDADAFYYTGPSPYYTGSYYSYPSYTGYIIDTF